MTAPTRKTRAASQVSSARGSRISSQEVVDYDISRSFQSESGVFGDAHIESSINTPDLSIIQEEEDVEIEEDLRPMFPISRSFNKSSTSTKVRDDEQELELPLQQQVQNEAERPAIEQMAHTDRFRQESTARTLPAWLRTMPSETEEKLVRYV